MHRHDTGGGDGAQRFSPERGHADLPDMQATHRRFPLVAIAAAVGTMLATGCGTGGTDPAATAAAAAFVAFQAALQRGDEGACRELLTHESAAALADLPWERLRQQQALGVLGARAIDRGRFHVAIQDASAGGRRSEFVVVREYGRLVVDLIATAGLHTEVVDTPTVAEPDIVAPRPLTPADFDRIRAHELAQPPR
jgi:hypothetical protein